MKFSIIILLICICFTAAFRTNARSPIVSTFHRSPIRMADKEIVPVDRERERDLNKKDLFNRY